MQVKPIAISDILKRKWSRRLIREILGEPLGTQRNPWHGAWSRMAYYDYDQVVRAEADQRWLRYQPERERLSAAGKRDARTRANKRKELA